MATNRNGNKSQKSGQSKNPQGFGSDKKNEPDNQKGDIAEYSRPELSDRQKRLIEIIDDQSVDLKNLVEWVELQSGVDVVWLETAISQLQLGFMSLRRAVANQDAF